MARVYALFLRGGGHTISPAPPDVEEATRSELHEPWMAELESFAAERLRPTALPSEAATASQVREAFAVASRFVGRKEVALRLAARGFAEAVTAVQVGQQRTTKRTYYYSFAAGEPSLVRLLAVP